MAPPLASDRPPQARDTPREQSGPRPDTTPSPWWTAPGGKPVLIPAFGRLLDDFASLIAPVRRLIPIRLRSRR